ncbi:ParB/RepB/Spo0J family partition protein [Plantactinospora sp. CA-294935]|uniref:ParB/RepB/Spo0J family partition protein n=1 Tax=Plantactinospora sp. CA-294935 TaxID=3240012 RepID=UPI003D91FAC5
MRVVDGMHRLRAALRRGQDVIAVRFFDGGEQDAFVAAVEANIAHGLPLTLADREAAASRIIRSHPWWSDRAIASVTGLAAATVRTIRGRTGTDDAPGETSRLGRDGRVRPLNGAVGRLAASAIIAERPDAPLREIAKAAGISPTTARDVRERMRRGDDPVPPRQRPGGDTGPDDPAPGRPTAVGHGWTDRSAPARDGAGAAEGREKAAILRGLRNDPSLRFTESGRALLRWLWPRVTGPEGWEDIVLTIPPHCTYLVADLARRCADEWLTFAEEMEQQARSMA